MRVTVLLFVMLIMASSCRDKHAHLDAPPGDEVILGIFGGMGPEATADLYLQILKLTPADADQKHIPTLIFSNTKVPDRVKAIVNGDTSIIRYLTYSVKKLEDAGADFIAIPCNTAHYFYSEMQAAVSVPIINMIKETANVVSENYPGLRKIGLLATTGTIKSGLYSRELSGKGYEVITPGEADQEEMVMKAVGYVKSGTSRKQAEDLIAAAGLHLAERGAELIVIGCTEIPLAYNPDRIPLPFVNATEVLAEKAVSMYFEQLKLKSHPEN
jgi:aspartate racemase